MIQKAMKQKSLSVIVPLYNEEENLPVLHRELVAATEGRFASVEFLFINDGSTDGSARVLDQLHQEDSRVKVIHFRKNFGQTAALMAGFDHCQGELVVSMDADLQNDPADIPHVCELLVEGYDMVNGWRKDRQDKLLSRRLPSVLGNRLISFITKVKLHDYGCALRGFRREVVKNLFLYGEMHRYLPALASRMGIRSIEIPVNHRARRFGSSKYGLSRTYRVILDLITLKYLLSFSHRPLQIFGGIGLLMTGTGTSLGLYLTLVKYLYNEPISGRPLLFLTMLLIFLGFQLITLGLLAEMLTKIYHEGLRKEPYSIRSTLGLPHAHPDDRP